LDGGFCCDGWGWNCVIVGGFARRLSTNKSQLKLSSRTVEIADCFHKFLELGDLLSGDFGSFNVALGVDTVFEAGSVNVPVGAHFCFLVPGNLLLD
jgi:hypothetical protein